MPQTVQSRQLLRNHHSEEHFCLQDYQISFKTFVYAIEPCLHSSPTLSSIDGFLAPSIIAKIIKLD